ncbi:MAG: alpha/beta hydrolase [Eubacteriales bacterium]|nr:alpha/beta hydrolase [Eubacteriales bacterium]
MGVNGSLDAGLTPEMKKNLFGNAYLNMLWHCPSDPRFHYWVHLPDCYYDEEKPDYTLFIIIQHTGRTIEEYMRAAQELTDSRHIALMAPVFPGGLVERDDINSYKLLSDQGIRYDLALLSMVDDMAARYPGVNTEKFFMFGHSGGGQFVNRFLFVHPNRLKAVSIGAPGRPTFLNFEEDYFWGVRDFKKYFDKELDLEAVKKVPVQITVGEKDTLFIGDSPYGDNRVSRMKSLKKNLEENGISTELEILPGLAHEAGDRERVQTALRFFEKLQ